MDYLNFRNTTKKKLSDFNLNEIRGWTIDSLYHIEKKIDGVISDYFKPEKKNDFDRVILNSSIISMGAKAKILRNIESFDKNIITKIQKMVSIRNAFAHLPITEDLTLSVTENKIGEVSTEITVISRMEIMTSSGEIKTRNSKELALDFLHLNTEIRDYLCKFTHT